MKSFFKTVLATVVGWGIVSVISFICFFFFSIIFFAVIAKSPEKKYILKDDSVFTLQLRGTLKDRAPKSNPLLDALSGDDVNDLGLDDILNGIRKAKENPLIKGIYIKAGMFSAPAASLEEIRNALLDFKKSDKFIVAYSSSYTQGCYYLSSLADRVILNPRGTVYLHGFSVNPTFYKGLFDKLGIEMQIFRVGTYKSYVEPYMLNQMSPANKQQTNSYLNDVWNSILTQISASRGISVKELNTITDSLPALRDPRLLVTQKLVDTLMYEPDVKKYINNVLGNDLDAKIRFADVDDLKSVKPLDKNTSDNEIAVLYAQGDIVSGSASKEIEDRYFVKKIESLQKDAKVKAVVFRVNSPGGSAYAAEQIWKAISDLKAVKPVVVSMGDYAASGGYYVSCNATKIFAQPTTITGSIGIFGMYPNIQGLTQKVGLTFDNVKTNKFSDFGDMTRPMTADEKAILQSYINQGYDLFLTRCSDGRHIPKDSLNMIAQGRVWTGNQALKLGLIDALGGMDDAIVEAAKLASLDSYSIQSYPKKDSFIEQFFKIKKEDFAAKAMKEYLGDDYEQLIQIKKIKDQDRIQARLPYGFEIN